MKVTAWPGQQFIIQLTGLDQFGRSTTNTARFNNIMVCFSMDNIVRGVDWKWIRNTEVIAIQ